MGTIVSLRISRRGDYSHRRGVGFTERMFGVPFACVGSNLCGGVGYSLTNTTFVYSKKTSAINLAIMHILTQFPLNSCGKFLFV